MFQQIKNFVKNNLGDFKYYFVSKFFIGFSWLLILKIISKNLSPLLFSEYTLLFIFTTFFSSINTLWITSSYIRFYNSKQIENLFSVCLKLLKVSVVVVGCLYVLSYWTLVKSELFNGGFKVFLCSSLYFLSNSVLLFYLGKYSGERKVKKNLFFNVFNISLILVFLYCSQKLDVSKIFFSFFFSNFLTLIFILISDKSPVLNININRTVLSKLFSYGFPIILVNIFVLGHSSIDQYLLRYYQLDYELGIYASNYSISDKSLLVFTNIYVSSFAPILFQNYNQNKVKTYSKYKRIVFIYILFIIPIILFILNFYDFIFGLILPANYLNPRIGKLILFGTVFNGASQILSEYFTLKKLTFLMAIIYLFPLLINFILNYYFIPIYKLDAAIYSTIITYFLLFLFLLTGIYFTSKKVEKAV